MVWGNINIRGGNGPVNFQVPNAIHRIAEEEGMLDNTIPTIELIKHLDDIVEMTQIANETEQTEHFPNTRNKPGRSTKRIILPNEKTKFPRARDRAKISPLGNEKSNGLAGINPPPITPTSPTIRKFGQSLLQRDVTRIEPGGGEGPKVSKITDSPDIEYTNERTPVRGGLPDLLKGTEHTDTQDYRKQKSKGMDLSEGSHRTFATDGPLNVSSSVCWVEEEKADRRTLIQCNQKFIDPIIEREQEWVVKKWESLIGGKGS